MNEKNIIYGIHPIREALEKNANIDTIFVNKNLLKKDSFSDILHEAGRRMIGVKAVPEEKLRKLTTGNHQGIIAFISPVTYYDIEDIVMADFDKGKTPLILILDSITDVRNFGAIARTADAAGVSAIVIPATGSVSVTPDAVKTSAGALMHIPVCKSGNMKHTIKYLQDSGIRVFAASEKAQKIYSNADFNVPAAIIMGSEETGVSAPLLRIADEWISIPMLGNVLSLNVSVSAGIIIYETIRQRNL